MEQSILLHTVKKINDIKKKQYLTKKTWIPMREEQTVWDENFIFLGKNDMKKTKKRLSENQKVFYRDNRTRTYDRTDMSRVLYQLSYIPK